MPELPEVETVRRGLAPHVEKHRIFRAEARRRDLRWPLPSDFAQRLEARRITSLARRGKFLLWHLDGGETLISHLGMSGRFLILAGGTEARLPGRFAHDPAGAQEFPTRHDHVVLVLAGTTTEPLRRIVFRDPRRFGAMDFANTKHLDTHPWLKGLGPEPLGESFTPEWLAERFRSRRAPVKNLLLDQRILAGLGNIYVSEALHRARIAPRRAGGRIGAVRIGNLVQAIRAVLLEAIEAGGSSLRDFRHADGELGYFQHQFAVYGREAEACPKPGCNGVIRRTLQSGRSSFWCPQCQR